MADPTPDPDQNPAPGAADEAAQDSGADRAPRGEAGPEGLTVDDILDTPQSSDAESADRTGSAEAAGAPAADALAAERLEELRRLQAEFVNFKHRTAREKEQLRTFVTGDLLQALLPVFDDIDAARQAGDLSEGPFASIANKLEEILVRQGLSRIGAVGEKFDPTVHEAVLQQPTSQVEPDQVSMVLRSGFKIGERIVRPAQVAVAVAE
ncbi:MAG TPA: nucleotide exchange factor GrpE [Streptomyces sp.]|jgi:molecular chaperone GrpE|nr:MULTISPECIES: nucleotide exchange factor GrpE [Actinomycetes]MCM3689202.1 nucleotide exchange factor GrpE [Kocuria rosea]HST71616.1 nucleotide exchange factor GrpE [Kocuria rosea]HWU06887.1 nucleotide exchange factor GrpE [Streptomyces sp.]